LGAFAALISKTCRKNFPGDPTSCTSRRSPRWSVP